MDTLFYIYKKTSEELDTIIPILKKHNVNQEDCRLFVDTNRDFIHYKEMKESMLREKGILFFNSLHSIGNTKESIFEELKWFNDNKIEIVVADMPSTHYFEMSELNYQSCYTMIDLFRILQNYPGFDFQNPDFSDGGRRKIRFPENWETLYKLYELKQITANEFQQRVGLKRATFFNLLSEYKQLLKFNALEYFKTETTDLNT